MTFKIKDGISIAGSTLVDGSKNITARTVVASDVVSATTGSFSGDITINQTGTENRGLWINESGTDSYGAFFRYDSAADILRIGTRSGSTTDVTALSISRNSTSITVPGSIYSQMFYDSNDTNYYCDPHNISKFSSMYITYVGGKSNSSSYTESALQIRERNFGGVQDATWATAPRLAFHWSGRVASQIAMSSDGVITILNNPGTGYEGFRCGNAYIPITYDGDDTSYYCNPNSQSYFSTLLLKGGYLDFFATDTYIRCTSGPGNIRIGDDDTVYLNGMPQGYRGTINIAGGASYDSYYGTWACGHWMVARSGDSALMRIETLGGSTGTVQTLMQYNTSHMFRNKTDENVWSAWRYYG